MHVLNFLAYLHFRINVVFSHIYHNLYQNYIVLSSLIISFSKNTLVPFTSSMLYLHFFSMYQNKCFLKYKYNIYYFYNYYTFI